MTTERVTVTLSSKLIARIDSLARNRSRFIAEAVERELARRRREALLSSVCNPHPETSAVADTELGMWPDTDLDETLVDAARGRGVRWIAGQGWMTESS